MVCYGAYGRLTAARAHLVAIDPEPKSQPRHEREPEPRTETCWFLPGGRARGRPGTLQYHCIARSEAFLRYPFALCTGGGRLESHDPNDIEQIDENGLHCQSPC